MGLFSTFQWARATRLPYFPQAVSNEWAFSEDGGLPDAGFEWDSFTLPWVTRSFLTRVWGVMLMEHRGSFLRNGLTGSGEPPRRRMKWAFAFRSARLRRHPPPPPRFSPKYSKTTLMFIH